MDGWMHACMHEWVGGRVDRFRNGQMDKGSLAVHTERWMCILITDSSWPSFSPLSYQMSLAAMKICP